MSADVERLDVVFCAAFVEAELLGESSTADYLRSWVAECDEQLRCEQRAWGAESRGFSYWLGRRDAYVDALRVLEIAADAARAAVEREREQLRSDVEAWQATAGES